MYTHVAISKTYTAQIVKLSKAIKEITFIWCCSFLTNTETHMYITIYARGICYHCLLFIARIDYP